MGYLRSVAAWPLVLVILISAPTLVFAQLPTARLATIFPPGGKAGSSFEVTVAGQDLDDSTELHFSNPSVSAKPKLNGKDGPAEPGVFLVAIKSDAPAGICEARVMGRFGISNPRAFVIGDLLETNGPSTNTTTASAIRVTSGSVVNSRVAANGSSWFKFQAPAGRRILVRCDASAIDSRLSEVLTLFDSNGNELERSRRGGLLDFTPSADGLYSVEVHDVTYRGGDEYFYRLTIGGGPWIDFIFPPSALPGSKGKFTFYGRNLPGGSPARDLKIDGKPLEQLEVEIEFPKDPTARQPFSAAARSKPADAAIDAFEYRLKSPGGISNPALLTFATGPVISGRTANHSADQAQVITVPCEVAGQFNSGKLSDWYTFDAKKGNTYVIEMFSQRLGLPTSPAILVQRVTKNDKGEPQVSDVLELSDPESNLGGQDFNTTSRDPIGRLEVKEDATYRVRVRDLFNHTQPNPRNIYRLSIRKEAPDFRLVVLPMQPPKVTTDSRAAFSWTPYLRRGETQVLKVIAFRRDGFSGEIELAIDGLPAGVTTVPARIDSGKNSTLIPLTAPTNATPGSAFLKITGKAKLGDTVLTREARGGSVVWNVPDYNTEPVAARLTRDLAIGVGDTEIAPITIEPVESKLYEAPVDGKLKIPIRVVRHAEFTEAFKLKAVGLSALDSLAELDISTKTNTATLEIDLAKFKIPVGTHNFYLQTQTKGKYRSFAMEAQKAEGDSAKADKAAASAASAAKKAGDELAAATKALAELEAQLKSVSGADQDSLKERVKTAAETKAAAGKKSTEAAAKVKETEEKKTAAQARYKDLKAKAAPKDAAIYAYSSPITIKITEATKK